MSTTTQAPPAVEYDPATSTKFHAVYLAQSRRHAHVTYRVVYDEAARSWSCQCPAATYGNVCGHIKAAKAEAEIRWWRALWADAPLGTLVYREAQIHEYLTAYPDGDDAQDKRCELSALGDLVWAATQTERAA